MSDVKSVIQLSFGKIKIIDFPKKTESFFDFPDGRLLVNRPITKEEVAANPLVKPIDLMADIANAGKIIHYQLDVNQNSILRVSLSKKTLDSNIEEVREALKKYVIDSRTDGFVIHSGLKSVERLVLAKRSPNRLSGNGFSTNMIHGINKKGTLLRTNDIDLYLARGIKFEMRGLPNNPARQRSYDKFTGVVTFAKREYAFIVRPNQYGWNNFGPRLDIETEDLVRAHREKLFRMVGVIDRVHVAEQITKALWHHFPFIQEYDMLDTFKFDPLLSLDEEMERWKQDRELAPVVRVAE